MTDEADRRWERQRDFLLEQQARFLADLGGLRERTDASERNIAKLVDVCFSLANQLGEVGRRVDSLGGRWDALAAQMEETRRAMREAQDDTSYKLNALIQTVDKLARRNGAGGA